MTKKPSELFEGENSSLRKTFDEATKQTTNQKIIDEFDKQFLTNPAKKIAYCNGNEKREISKFLMDALEQKDKEWKEKIKKALETGYEFNDETFYMEKDLIKNLDL